MANGIRTGNPRGFNKGCSLKFLKVCEFDKHLKKAGGHIVRNTMKIIIKMKTIVQKPLMIKIIKLRLRNLDNLNFLLFLEIFLFFVNKIIFLLHGISVCTYVGLKLFSDQKWGATRKKILRNTGLMAKTLLS